jgi:hypothetical protein
MRAHGVDAEFGAQILAQTDIGCRKAQKPPALIALGLTTPSMAKGRSSSAAAVFTSPSRKALRTLVEENLARRVVQIDRFSDGHRDAIARAQRLQRRRIARPVLAKQKSAPVTTPFRPSPSASTSRTNCIGRHGGHRL